ncbi:hypothetical protein ACWEKT_32235 [Nocardia takedensis]
MTITPIRHACARGPLISIEGITGVGKTYLTHRALDTLTDRPVLLEGFTQRADGRPGLGKSLLGALRHASGGDPFLRTGTPLAEALLLLAIKRHDLDTVLPELAAGRTVIEGRSVDSTAVCQALLLHPDNPRAALDAAVGLLRLAAAYRPLPDLTILITDDPAHAVARTQHRDRYLLTGEQATFMHHAGALYEQLAATDPTRCRILDRRTVDEHEAADQIRDWIHSADTDTNCLREPWQGFDTGCLCCGHSAVPA